MSTQDVTKWLNEQEQKLSEPIRLESEAVFDTDLERPDPGAFIDDPIKLFAGLVGDLKEIANRPQLGILADLPPTEHRVRIFQINNDAGLEETAAEIEELLNDGWCCHHPTVCNDFLIMDFARRKESEEDGE